MISRERFITWHITVATTWHHVTVPTLLQPNTINAWLFGCLHTGRVPVFQWYYWYKLQWRINRLSMGEAKGGGGLANGGPLMTRLEGQHVVNVGSINTVKTTSRFNPIILKLRNYTRTLWLVHGHIWHNEKAHGSDKLDFKLMIIQHHVCWGPLTNDYTESGSLSFIFSLFSSIFLWRSFRIIMYYKTISPHSLLLNNHTLITLSPTSHKHSLSNYQLSLVVKS